MRNLHSIRFQFIAYIGTLLLVLLLLLNTWPLTSSRDAVFEEKRSSMTGQASTLSSSLAALDNPSRESISEVLRYLDLSGYARIIVTDEAGAILYDTAGSAASKGELEDLNKALEGYVVFRSRFDRSAFSSGLAMPISSAGTLRGAVYLREYDTERAEIILQLQTQLRTVSLIIGAAALVLAVLYVVLLMRRLQALTRSMHVVAEGDYAYRHPVRGRDEISELGKEFNLLTEKLQTTEEQRRRFVSDASHELKTPLASIRLLSDSIVQNSSMDSETIREFVTDIGSEAQRLQRTTEKLLTLSRMDDGVQRLREPVDCKQVVLDALVPLLPLAKEKSVTLRHELAEGCVIMATVDDLFQVIFNLTENAIKYNVPEGSVLLRVDGDEQSVRLTVEDTGIGIPEGDRLNIFSRFYRVDKARSREAGGSGLGLSIVHDTVLALGGSIAVGQNKPQGSIFVVSFPRPSSEETGI